MVYAVLWVAITGLYVAVALLLGVSAGGSMPLPLAILATVAATVVVAPVRRWLDAVADRVVFGRRLSGYELIAGLGHRLAEEPTNRGVAQVVAEQVREGLGLQWVRVLVGSAPPAVAGTAGTVPSEAEATEQIPLAHGALGVGSIECGPRRRGPLTRADREVLLTLGRQAALAVHSSWLADQLADRVAALDSSRARLVHAQDVSRRRIERDLHDGVQQELVALLTRLGLARNQLLRDPALAERTLAEGIEDTRRALLSLQEVARGISPPLLRDRGITAAVTERVSRLPIPVAVHDHLAPQERFASDIEAAAYFVVSEALANVLKHAGARAACVDLDHAPGRLRIQVSDDGAGFEPSDISPRGLTGLRDRIEALGGALEVTSRPEQGTTLVATVPTIPAQAAAGE
jgi:signal transduction histidine kinase